MVDSLVERKFEIYPFYKSPDGEDCLEKTYHYTRYGAMAGAVFSVYEMVLMSKPKTVHGCIARLVHFTGPLAFAGFTFGSALCIMGQLRKKDAVTNHLVAGLLAGSVYGAKYRCLTTGHYWAFILGINAAAFKFCKMNNIAMFSFPPRDKDENYPNLDLTIKMYDDPGRPDRA